VQVSRQDARGVADRLPSTKLELIGAQRQGLGAELGGRHLKRDPGPGGWPLEQKRHRSHREDIGTKSLAASPLQLQRPFEERFELLGAQLLAGQEMTWRTPTQAGDSTAGWAGNASRRAWSDTAETVQLRVLTWNLYHGRDFPPDPALLTRRSRLLRLSERGATHVQVNRDLFGEFATVLGRADWDIALLQECPPRWSDRLAASCGAEAHRVLTARNTLAAVRALAARINPDLIGSNEGGSNLTLVRGHAGSIVERRALVLRAALRPERRALAFARLRLAHGAEICVSNLHASAGRANRALAEEEVVLAAERSVQWAGGGALVLGGDLNVRPRESRVFDELADRHGLRGATSPEAIDHLLVRDLEPVEPPREWSPPEREVREGGLSIRLSDHAPVEAAFALPASDGANDGTSAAPE
jgi:endonuclease/exonuclease/phosphatase family metal-dependent hydrolase